MEILCYVDVMRAEGWRALGTEMVVGHGHGYLRFICLLGDRSLWKSLSTIRFGRSYGALKLRSSFSSFLSHPFHGTNPQDPYPPPLLLNPNQPAFKYLS